MDFGRKEEMQASSMQQLQGEEERPAFALRCHLSGVQPAGDITRWSQTATEYLIDTVREKTVFIVPKVSKGSLFYNTFSTPFDELYCFSKIPTAQGKRGEKSLSGNLEILPKHREFGLLKLKSP